jgi:hypothetical protein
MLTLASEKHIGESPVVYPGFLATRPARSPTHEHPHLRRVQIAPRESGRSNDPAKGSTVDAVTAVDKAPAVWTGFEASYWVELLEKGGARSA